MIVYAALVVLMIGLFISSGSLCKHLDLSFYHTAKMARSKTIQYLLALSGPADARQAIAGPDGGRLNYYFAFG
jgi:hypothetical protein